MMQVDMLKWFMPWEPSVTVITFSVCLAALYIRGCARCGQHFIQKLFFWVGLISLHIVSQTDFDYYSEHEFFMHRIQHVMLHHFGPFLIALGRPGGALTAGMPITWRLSVERLRRSPQVEILTGFMNNPVIAVLLFIGLIVFWLIPPIHFIAMLDWRLYRLMNWGMVLNGLMFWNLVLNNYALRPAKLSPACRIVIMLAVIPPQIVIGVLLFLATHELYPIYSLCGRAFDMSALADQQLGGLILWIPAAMMSVIGVMVVMGREWMGPKPTRRAIGLSLRVKL
jgi:putative membrane protein